MLSEKVFTCACCKELLELPVMIVENKGNVCNSCFQDNEDFEESLSIPNTKLDAVIKELEFFCKYQLEGCAFSDIYENLKSHEDDCLYRTIGCLLPKADCKWSGKLNELLKHFKEQHSQLILKSPFNKFSFEMCVNSPINIIKLLVNHQDKVFILKIWETENEKFIMNLVQEIKPIDEEKYLVLKYIGKYNEHKFKLKRYPFTNNTSNFEQTAEKVSTTILGETAKSSETIQVEVNLERPQTENITETLLKHLECPICKELMRPPINQCSSGHSFCSSCKKRIAQCPTCQAGWSTARNYCLEGITSSVEYPCSYSNSGCEEVYLGNEIADHESVCKYKLFTCPITDCKFSGNYTLCKNHFALNHNEFFIEGTVYEDTFTLLPSSSSEETKYFFEHENIYKFKFYRDAQTCSWHVQILNDFGKNFKYTFSITVTDAQYQQTKISKSIFCLNKDQTDEDGIIFRNNDLSAYRRPNNDRINYRLEIFIYKI